MSDFRLGDVVELTCGGTRMTVTLILLDEGDHKDDARIYVSWHDANHQLQNHMFYAMALRKVID